MNIVVREDLKAYIDPLTPEEYEALERSLLAEGCRDALVLWGDVLVDGHNRYALCQKHGLPFQTVQSTLFQSLEDVHLWMIDQHLGRRSVSDFQRGVLALRKREILAQQRARFLASASEQADVGDAEGEGHDTPPWDEAAAPVDGPAASAPPAPLKTREDIAKAARLRSSQVVMIEKIQKQATPEVVAAVKAGALSLSAAAAVATLPAEEQQAAASGGAAELKQAAKRVRAAKRPPREAAVNPGKEDAEAATATSAELQALQRRVAELTAENDALRKQVANLLSQLAR